MYLSNEELAVYNTETLSYIKDSYFLFKVCEACDGIAYYSTPVCIQCKGYRFDDTYPRILESIRMIKRYKRQVNSCRSLLGD